MHVLCFNYKLVKIAVVMAIVGQINGVPLVHRSHLNNSLLQYYSYVAKWYTVEISFIKRV